MPQMAYFESLQTYTGCLFLFPRIRQMHMSLGCLYFHKKYFPMNYNQKMLECLLLSLLECSMMLIQYILQKRNFQFG